MNAVAAREEQDLRHYLRSVRRRWKLVAGLFVATVAFAALASALQTPTYRAESVLLLSVSPSEELVADQAGRYRSSADAARTLNNEMSFIEGGVVQAAVAEAYDGPLDLDDVQVTATSAEADVVSLAVVSTDPAEAARLVNTYVDTYVRVYREQRTGDLLATGAEIQTQIDSVDRDIVAALAAGRPTTALESRRAFFDDQLDQLEVGARLAQTGGVQVVSRASEPTTPVSPRVVRDLMVAVVAGAVLGIGAAIVRERFDETVTSKEECEVAAGRPALGLIPLRRRRTVEVVALRSPESPVAEAYRGLRTSIRFLGLDGPARVVQVTSAVASEGKTTVAANLAAVAARAGERAVVVGLDLRRPRLDELFEVGESPGAAGVLAGDAKLDEVTVTVVDDDNLHLVPTGAPPANPSKILESGRLGDLVEDLRRRYDVVVLDCPPLLPVTDALEIAQWADVVLLVVASGLSSRRNVAHAAELLVRADAPYAGAVLSRVTGEGSYEKGYYGYGRSRSRPEPVDGHLTAPLPATTVSSNGGPPPAEHEAAEHHR